MLDFQFIGDPQNAQAMSAYMRNQFPFIGLKSPQRKTQEKPLLQQAKAWDQSQLLDAFAELYAKPEREYQYAALALARKYATRFNFDGIQTLARYVTVKSWWDTVDNLRPIFFGFIYNTTTKTCQKFGRCFSVKTISGCDAWRSRCNCLPNLKRICTY